MAVVPNLADIAKHVVKCVSCGRTTEIFSHHNDFSDYLCSECEYQRLEANRLEAAKEVIRSKFGDRYVDCTFDKTNDTVSPDFKAQFKQAIAFLKPLPVLIANGKHRKNCIYSLVGTNGTGKTTLAVCLVWECYLQKIRYAYVKAKAFLDHVKRFSYSPDWEERADAVYQVKRLKETPILIIDECHMIAGTKEDISVLYEIIDYRESHLLDTVLIGNINNTPEAFTGFFGAELTDRIRATGNMIFSFYGKSMRVR